MPAPRVTSISGVAPVPLTVKLYGFSFTSLLLMLTAKSKAPADGVTWIVNVVLPAWATVADGWAVTLTAGVPVPGVTPIGTPSSRLPPVPLFWTVHVNWTPATLTLPRLSVPPLATGVPERRTSISGLMPVPDTVNVYGF